MKSTVVLLLSCVMVCVNAMELEESLGKIANVRTGSGNNRKEPRLFLVTTATTTSTLRTNTLCWCSVGNTAVTATQCRRKRSIMDDSIDNAELSPTKSSPPIDSGFEDEDNFLETDLNHRAARQNFFNFLLYWATTTSTSTSTSYTGTGILNAAGGCTPSGMSLCTGGTSATCA